MKIIKTLLTISILLFKSITCFGQWSSDITINNPISTAQNNQSFPRVVSDDSGGAIIVWNDDQNGTSNMDIYAQRIDANGVIQWTTDGIEICTAVNDQSNVEIISDGNGGAIIAWNDYRNSAFWDLYAQKINSSGVVQWVDDGVAVCTASYSNYNPQMISDGNGGAIITWMDNRIINNSGDIYAQSINSAGVAQWVADGIVICNDIGHSAFPKIVSDGSTGAIITWEDSRNDSNDVYAQRINSSGVVQWANNGNVISNAIDTQFRPSIISDNNGGAIITWNDWRELPAGGDSDIYSQHVNSNGIVQWTNDGIPICTSISSQNSPDLVSDNNGGAIITWTDYRTSANSADIYAQRVNPAGITQWSTNGIPVSTASYVQWFTKIIPDGNNGAIITWVDKRLGSYSDIYAQRVNFNGVVQWATNGEPISTASNIQRNPYIVSSLNGGAIITWADFRTGTDYDVYAQLINMNGELSTEEFSISNNSLYSVFPNPSKGIITIQSVEKVSSIFIINQLGEIVYKEHMINSTKKEIDLSMLSNGIYIYQIISESNMAFNGKLIFTH